MYFAYFRMSPLDSLAPNSSLSRISTSVNLTLESKRKLKGLHCINAKLITCNELRSSPEFECAPVCQLFLFSTLRDRLCNNAFLSEPVLMKGAFLYYNNRAYQISNFTACEHNEDISRISIDYIRLQSVEHRTWLTWRFQNLCFIGIGCPKSGACKTWQKI
jgi:hypothetical protein